MQLQEAVPPNLRSKIAFAGSVKADGTWGSNSLFNNEGFREEMNDAFKIKLDQEERKKLRAKMKAGYKDVPCEPRQVDEAKKLFSQSKYKIAR